MQDLLKIRVSAFTLAAISEALADYGFEGDCRYNEGARQGFVQMLNGTYRFNCDFAAGTIEISELVINVEGLLDASLN